MDPVLLDDIDLIGTIQQIEFEEGPPMYMEDVKPCENPLDTRFTLDSLQSLYKQFRKNQSDNTLIDA